MVAIIKTIITIYLKQITTIDCNCCTNNNIIIDRKAKECQKPSETDFKS